MSNKRGIEHEVIIFLLIALLVMAISLGAYMIFKTKGISAIDFLKHLWRGTSSNSGVN